MKALNNLIVRTLPLIPKPVVQKIASRYVAGETLERALEVVRQLNAAGCMSTLAVLGEDLSRREEAEGTVEQYVRALSAIAASRLDSNISVKLTALGLRLDPRECRRQFGRILQEARQHDHFVRIDMEDSSVTEETIQIFLEALQTYRRVGLVLQAYLHRSLEDARRAARVRANVRICKGIYVEPSEIAYQDREAIRQNFLRLVDFLLGEGCYLGIATHDEFLVRKALESIERLHLPREAYEFQMLLGVANDLRRRLVGTGHRLRVYVPFGESWYSYSMRRLKENPEIAGYVFKGLFVRR